MPRKEGGRVVKNIKAFNLALVNKWRWRCVIDLCASWTPLLVHHYGDLRKSLAVNHPPMVEGLINLEGELFTCEKILSLHCQAGSWGWISHIFLA